MELDRTKIIIISIMGIVICSLAAGAIWVWDESQKDKIQETDINALTPPIKEKEKYDIDNREREKSITEKMEKMLSSKKIDETFNIREEHNDIDDKSQDNESELIRIQKELEKHNDSFHNNSQKEFEKKKVKADSIISLINGGQEKATKKKNKKKTQEQRETKEEVKSSRFSNVRIENNYKTNAIHAFVHSQQTVQVGSTLKMRVAEDCQTDDGRKLSKNTFVYGIVTKIGDQRVHISISYVNINGNILPFKKDVYSRDAQIGIYVPETAKTETLNEASSGALEGANVSMTMPSTNLGVAAGVSAVNGIVGGVKTAKQKNIRKTKVTIKTNYEVLFMPKKNADMDNE